MSLIIRNTILASLMITSMFIAKIFAPTDYIADERPEVTLNNIIPQKIGDWTMLPQESMPIISPEVLDTINEIYTDTLSRTYYNSEGQYVMLAIAYGKEQSDAKQLHYPEVCYPAQGFQLESAFTDEVVTPFLNIPVKRLVMKQSNRNEPITYWATVGSEIVISGSKTKLAQLNYGLKGMIPDGLLFRVSSINAKNESAYTVQDKFITDLLEVVSDDTRFLLIGRI